MSLTIGGQVQAQICEPDTTLQTTPTANFSTINPDPSRYPVTLPSNGSEILDLSTGLVWQRCSVGQTWNSEFAECTGVPEKLIWKSALDAARSVANITQKAWRMPNIKEMMSIVDFQCYAPPFNLEVFPNTPASVKAIADDPNITGYWTSTPMISYGEELAKRESNSERTFAPMSAWYVDAESGLMRERAVQDYPLLVIRNPYNFLRLVR